MTLGLGEGRRGSLGYSPVKPDRGKLTLFSSEVVNQNFQGGREEWHLEDKAARVTLISALIRKVDSGLYHL